MSLDFLASIAESRIREAIERGEFDHLAGAGKPLVLDDDAEIPVELRMAYRILKNAGCIPPEIELRREIATAEDLLACAATEQEHTVGRKRLELLLTRLSSVRGGRDLRLEQAYYSKLTERLSKNDKRKDGAKESPA